MWKRKWWILSWICWEIVRDRAAGWANTKIDDNAEIAMSGVREFINEYLSYPLSVSILVIVFVLLILFIHSYITEAGARDLNKKGPESDGSQPQNQPAFNLSDKVRLLLKRTRIVGVPRGLVRASGESNIEINDSLITTDTQFVECPLPTGKLSGESNVQLHARVKCLVPGLYNFNRRWSAELGPEMEHSSLPSEFNDKYQNDVHDLLTEIVSRLPPIEREPLSSSCLSGIVSVLYGKPVGIDPYAGIAEFLEFSAGKLPDVPR